MVGAVLSYAQNSIEKKERNRTPSLILSRGLTNKFLHTLIHDPQIAREN